MSRVRPVLECVGLALCEKGRKVFQGTRTFGDVLPDVAKTAPDRIEFYKPEELIVFLPPRTPRLRPGAAPPGVGTWELTELRGIGECSEVWLARDPVRPLDPPAALKFATDPEARDRMKAA